MAHYNPAFDYFYDEYDIGPPLLQKVRFLKIRLLDPGPLRPGTVWTVPESLGPENSTRNDSQLYYLLF